MAVTNGWGQAAVNNTIDYGKGKTTATNDWGAIYDSSASGDTSLGTAAAFSNTKSLIYDGIDAFVKTDATYSVLDGQTKASFSIWLKPDSGAPKLEYVLSNPRDSSGNNGQFGLVLYEGNSVTFFVQSRTSQKVTGSISHITYGSWNHILVTIDLALSSGNEGKVYINGVDRTTLSAMGTLGSFYTATDRLHIGEEANAAFNPYDGKMDELAIWSGTTLTSSDATALYNSGAPANLNAFSTPPTNWWRFEEGSGTAISDSVGSANATIQNDATFSDDIPA